VLELIDINDVQSVAFALERSTAGNGGREVCRRIGVDAESSLEA
jgi:hypothetical protein